MVPASVFHSIIVASQSLHRHTYEEQEGGLNFELRKENNLMKSTAFEGFPTHFHLKPYEGSEVTGVNAFDIGENYIIVEFKDGRIYLYNQLYPGKEHLEKMKNKAVKGDKLGTYINQNVRDNFMADWDKREKKFKVNRKFN